MQVNPRVAEACYAKSSFGGCGVPAYRLYRLDGAGKITNAEWIEAEADERALRQARLMVDGTPSFELWDRKRLVARFRNGIRLG